MLVNFNDEIATEKKETKGKRKVPTGINFECFGHAPMHEFVKELFNDYR